ncbi:hypothetical protein HZB97_01800, partial [Candidatus Gottesmanbacteria bacterium]|nr:hypothetical protein [Candidatus Gottesmanbacteria bacterium]
MKKQTIQKIISLALIVFLLVGSVAPWLVISPVLAGFDCPPEKSRGECGDLAWDEAKKRGLSDEEAKAATAATYNVRDRQEQEQGRGATVAEREAERVASENKENILQGKTPAGASQPAIDIEAII